jgi:hypothetical protein
MTFTTGSVTGGAERVAQRARLPDRRCRALHCPIRCDTEGSPSLLNLKK